MTAACTRATPKCQDHVVFHEITTKINFYLFYFIFTLPLFIKKMTELTGEEWEKKLLGKAIVKEDTETTLENDKV